MNRFWPARLLWYSVLSITSVVSSGALCDEEKQRVETSQEILTFKGHAGAVQTVAFSPDGNSIASAGRDSAVKVWNASTGKMLLVLKVDSGFINTVAFSPEGKRIAAAQRSNIKVWDLAVGENVHTLPTDSDW
ncbi:MAG: hypothetical protein QGG71_26120, partial [Pirellulaceae bacterium]|nr:hypothetical protein [Pirellulaceae bacterium]